MERGVERFTGRITELFNRYEAAVFLCGKCGNSRQGRDLKMDVNGRTARIQADTSLLAVFPCECGGWFEPMEA
jgi:hypothetical protein